MAPLDTCTTLWYPYAVGTPPTIHTRAAAFAQRTCVAYLLLYLLPFPLDCFPLDRVPGVTASIDALLTPWHVLVAWIGESIFAVAVGTPSATDTTYNYVAMSCIAALAFMIAVLYPLLARSRELSGRSLDRARGYAALYLGTHLLPYGWQKLIPTQMPEPGPDRLIIPYGDMSPTGVLWTFMGTSVGYQMFTGLIEAASGTLLFWRRTRLLGAFLASMVMSNVVALNFGFDVPLKLFSTHLMALALFVIAPDARRILAVFLCRGTVAPRHHEPYPILRPLRRWLAWSAKLTLLLAITIRDVVLSVEFIYTRGRLAPESPLHGVYRVRSFTRDGVTNILDDQRWLRVGMNDVGTAAIQRADGSATRYSLKIDEAQHSITFVSHRTRENFSLDHTTTADGELLLEGTVDGASITAILQKQTDLPSPAKYHFRWVQGGFVNH